MTGATGNVYVGLHEFEDMGFLLHYLRPEDLFVDVGANIGSYTILASGHVGCSTIAIEPIPDTFKKLKRNVEVNEIQDRVQLMNIAVGERSGYLSFTSGLDTMNHVAASNESEDVIEVPVETLDSVINDGSCPAMMKIDVEGFESNVIAGADRLLKDPRLNVLIIELNGSGKRYGFEDEAIHKTIVHYGFKTCVYDPINRGLYESKTYGTMNTLYIKNIPIAQTIVSSASKFKISNQYI